MWTLVGQQDKKRQILLHDDRPGIYRKLQPEPECFNWLLKWVQAFNSQTKCVRQKISTSEWCGDISKYGRMQKSTRGTQGIRSTAFLTGEKKVEEEEEVWDTARTKWLFLSLSFRHPSSAHIAEASLLKEDFSSKPALSVCLSVYLSVQ